jgi:molybdopterin-biosynthesis enzyme MoeA-like protein
MTNKIPYIEYLTKEERIAIEDLGFRIRQFKEAENELMAYRQSLEEELRDISARAYIRTRRA